MNTNSKIKDGRFALELLVALLAVAIGGPGARASEQRVDAVVNAVEKLSPSVVNISTDREVVDPFFERFSRFFPDPPKRRVRSAGSGVIFTKHGYVLTNFHVVRDVARVQVALVDGRSMDARFVAGDPERDLAVLEIASEEEFAAATFARSDELYVGETVIAMGNPFGLANTVSRGVLSAVGRDIRARGPVVFHNLLQTDAAINPGNSGGPLVDIDAEVIGINVAMQAGAENIGFAIPISAVKDFLLDVATDPWSASNYTGMRVRREGADERLVVDSVEPASGAGRAGIKPGDVIVRVSSRPIRGVQDYFAAFFAVARGTRIPVTVLRRGDEREFELELGELEPAAVILGKLALTVRDLDGRTNTSYDQTDFTGALILRVEEGSEAHKAGILAGDAIVVADGRRLEGSRDLAAVLEGKRSGEVVSVEMLRLMRSGRGSIIIRSVTVDIPVR